MSTNTPNNRVLKIYKAKFNELEGRNRQCINNERLKTYFQQQKNKTEEQEGNNI